MLEKHPNLPLVGFEWLMLQETVVVVLLKLRLLPMSRCTCEAEAILLFFDG